MTHHRIIFGVGEFGQKANPPWTRERALKTLIEQDGYDPEVAAKRVNELFDGQKSKS